MGSWVGSPEDSAALKHVFSLDDLKSCQSAPTGLLADTLLFVAQTGHPEELPADSDEPGR